MKFIILMSNSDDEWEALSAAAQERIMRNHEEVTAALRREGRLISTTRLRPAREAKTFRKLASGAGQVLDGPFCETKEAVGGFYVIEAASIDEATRWAERLRFMPGANEVRALWED